MGLRFKVFMGLLLVAALALLMGDRAITLACIITATIYAHYLKVYVIGNMEATVHAAYAANEATRKTYEREKARVEPYRPEPSSRYLLGFVEGIKLGSDHPSLVAVPQGEDPDRPKSVFLVDEVPFGKAGKKPVVLYVVTEHGVRDVGFARPTTPTPSG